mgnify:CR=1 FL=1
MRGSGQGQAAAAPLPVPAHVPASDFLPEQNDRIQDALADCVMDLRGLMSIISERIQVTKERKEKEKKKEK